MQFQSDLKPSTMTKLETLVRPNILALTAYSSARDEYKGKEGTFLDANENPFGNLNRYPDPQQKKLKKLLADFRAVQSKNIFVGNGSDELIDLVFRIFCEPSVDKALTFTPTYGMYDVSAAINNVSLTKLPLNDKFQIDLTGLEPHLKDERLKLIFICSPNNPTGNLINPLTIESILQRFGGIVIIDEAYIDFTEANSLVSLIKKYDNLIVSQTMSKAWGLAAARVGIAYANEEIIKLLNKVKPPYNVSLPNQNAAITAINNLDAYKSKLKLILQEKERMKRLLGELVCVKKIYPSDANFLLVKVTNADGLYKQLIDKKVITRNRNKQIPNCLRISIGKPEENNNLLKALKTIS